METPAPIKAYDRSKLYLLIAFLCFAALGGIALYYRKKYNDLKNKPKEDKSTLDREKPTEVTESSSGKQEPNPDTPST